MVRLRQMQAKLQPMLDAQYQCFDEIKKLLAKRDICVLRYKDLDGRAARTTSLRTTKKKSFRC